MHWIRTVVLLTLILFASPAFAQNQQDGKETESANEESQRTFAGLKFGVGLSFTWDVIDRKRVSEAIIDANGIVRVNKTSNAITRIMLESHYLFALDGQAAVDPKTKRTVRDARTATRAVGPFVSVQPGSDEIINALGAGVMFAFRYAATDTGSFNLGFGYAVDPNSKVLGDEFVADAPAPLGPDGKPLPIRFVDRDQGGFLMLASFTW